MYTGNLDVRDLKTVWDCFEGPLGQHTSTYEIRTLVQVYVLADRLMLDPLRDAARQRVSGWDIEYAHSTGYKQHIMKINLNSLVDLLKAVYELTPEDDPIRTNITIRGMRAYFRLYSDCKARDAASVLKIMRDHEPVGTGVALELLSPEGYVELPIADSVDLDSTEGKAEHAAGPWIPGDGGVPQPVGGW